MKRDSGAAFYEFFAGGGFARMGLAQHFQCSFANDNDPNKARAYRTAFGDKELRVGDVWSLSSADLPGRAALAWASFPCQDLSLAGARGGLAAPRSGAFFGFWRLIEALDAEGRAPGVIALENVCGLLTSHGGADFAALIEALDGRGYRAGAVVVDAALFAPQSRPRLFVIATRNPLPRGLVASEPSAPFHTSALTKAVAQLPEALRKRFVWWRVPEAPGRNALLADVLDDDALCAWRSDAQTTALLAQMNEKQRARVKALQADGARHVGAVFRRIRIEDGVRVQRAEARFDGLAGCLRTPAGGSSRQMLLCIERARVRSRFLSPREAARLMGVGEGYELPESQTAALHLIGDAVCVSAVRWLCEHLIVPLAEARAMART